MLCDVKVVFIPEVKVSPLEERFDGIFINEQSEMLFLYQCVTKEDGEKYVERYSIPLNHIETLEVKPCV